MSPAFREIQLAEILPEVKSLESLLSRSDQHCVNLQSSLAALTFQFDRKTSENKINRSILLDEITSLEDQLQKEREAGISRSAELDARKESMRLRQTKCDEQHALISRSRAQLEQDRLSLLSQQAALLAQQTRQEGMQRQIEFQAKALAEREAQIKARDTQQKHTQRCLDDQLKQLLEREQKIAAFEAKQLLAFHVPSVTAPSTIQVEASQGPIGTKLAPGSNTRVAGKLTTGESRAHAVIPTTKKAAQTAPRRINDSSVVTSTKPVGSVPPRSTLAPSRTTDKSRTTQVANSSITKVDQVTRANRRTDIPHPLPEAKTLNGGSRVALVKATAKSGAPEKVASHGNAVIREAVRRDLRKQDNAPCDSPSSQRKMRSAPTFVKKERVPRSPATVQPNKFSANDIVKNPGPGAISAPNTAPASSANVINAKGAQVIPGPKPVGTTGDQQIASRVPISKRLQRQFAGRAIPIFA